MNNHTVINMEASRKKAKTCMIIMICLWIIGIAEFFTDPHLSFFKNGGFLYSWILIAVILAVGTILLRLPFKNFRMLYKKEFVFNVISSIGDITTYDPKRGITKETIGATGMMSLGDSFHSEDYVEGKINGVDFKQSDVTIDRHVRRNGKPVRDNIFRGRWMIFSFHKEFANDLLVAEKGFDGARAGAGILTKKENRFQKVEFENEIFNKRFNTYAKDPHDAFYILTPHMMEAIMKLDEQSNCDTILCFSGQELHVGLHNIMDSFEANIWKPIDQEKMEASVKKDMKVAVDFVEGLRMNQDIFRGGAL